MVEAGLAEGLECAIGLLGLVQAASAVTSTRARATRLVTNRVYRVLVASRRAKGGAARLAGDVTRASLRRRETGRRCQRDMANGNYQEVGT